MSSTTRVKQMAHLKQKQISDKSCKAIIIDTLLEAVSLLTPTELSGEIAALFHVLISPKRLNQLIDALSKDLKLNELRFSNILSKSGVLLICKTLIYQGFFILLIGSMHSEALKMRNDYFCTSRYLNTVFSQILVISGFKGLRRLISQCPVRAYLIVKLNILCFDNDERPSYIFSSRRTGVHLLY